MSYSPLYSPRKAFNRATSSQNGLSIGRLISLHEGYEPNPETVTPPSSPTNKVTREGLRLYSDSGSSFSFDPSLLLYNLKGYTGSPFTDFTSIAPSYVNTTPSNLPYFACTDFSIPNEHLLPPPVTRNNLLFPITVPGGMRSQFAVPFYYLNPQFTKAPYDPFAIVPAFNVPISQSLTGRFIGGSINAMFPAEDNGYVLDVFLRQLATQLLKPDIELLNFLQYHSVVQLRPVALPHFIALKDQVRGEVASLSDLAQMVDPDTLPTDSKQDVVVAGQVWRMPTCRIREVRFGTSDSLRSKSRPLYSDNGCNFSLYVPIHNFSPSYVKTWSWRDSDGKKHEFSSAVCSDVLELEWNMPSATRTFSILGPVHDRRRNNWESYLEGHGSTFVDLTDEFLLGDELISLEFYVHVWRSDPDLTYAEIERGVVAKVAPDCYRPHRGCISRSAFTARLKRFTTFKDPYGQNETVFDRGSGRVLTGKRNIVEETSFVLWFTSTLRDRELVWMMEPRMFTKWIDRCCNYEWAPQHSSRIEWAHRFWPTWIDRFLGFKGLPAETRENGWKVPKKDLTVEEVLESLKEA
ncbi:hypothetical protein BT96DRAFT_1004880 [Gymnopus androsaceus JB14]|uniref:Uncharacterized protein n=1 Tax=Gymnopus androsaceus JB14 TaxID=1447944 RepID=A0A6A4GR74_9AGAR|nr:hypothetical protein BT96DRAFT_1004880 [Gymnopus androsaceus JB14]